MAAAFVASADAGDAQTVTTASLSITIPGAAAAGQVAVLFADVDSTTVTLTTPTGWTLRSGPDVATASGWVYTKTLVSGDVGTAQTLTYSAASKNGATMMVFSGVGEDGI